MLLNKCQFNKCPFNATDNSRAYLRLYVLTDAIAVAEGTGDVYRLYDAQLGDQAAPQDDRTATYVPGGGGGPQTFTRNPLDGFSIVDARFKQESKIRFDAVSPADFEFITQTRNRAESISVTDARFKTMLRVLLDALSVSDSATATKITGALARVLTSNMIVYDAGRQASWTIDTLAALTIADAVTALRSGSSVRTLTDAVTLVDARFKRIQKLVSETLDISDQAIATRISSAIFKTLTETITASDVGRQASWTLDTTGAVSVTDGFVRTTASIIKILTESLDVYGDGVRRTMRLTATEDDLALTDSFIRVGAAVTRVLSESVALSDARFKQVFKVVAELLATTDSALLRKNVSRVMSDSLVAQDAVTKLLFAGARIVVFTDLVELNDAFGRFRNRSVVMGDYAALTDALQASLARGRMLTDAIVVADAFIKALVSTGNVNERTLTDTTVVVDSLIVYRRIVKVVSELITTLDTITATTSGVRAITSTDTVPVTDAGTLATRLRTRIATETFTVSDQRFRAVLRMRDVIESIRVEDGHVKFFLRTRALIDALGISDSLASNIVRFAGSIVSVDIRIAVESAADLGVRDDILLGLAPSPAILGGV